MVHFKPTQGGGLCQVLHAAPVAYSALLPAVGVQSPLKYLFKGPFCFKCFLFVSFFFLHFLEDGHVIIQTKDIPSGIPVKYPG